jgi:hypothetical protein
MKDEKGRPMTYWGGLEPTDPYEKGFIDGMAKQRDSRVQQTVEGYAQMRELTDEEIVDALCLNDEDFMIYIATSPQAKEKLIQRGRALLKCASGKTT